VTDNRILFAIAKTFEGAPIVVLGIPEAAWEYMRQGQTHQFDLRKAGVPVQLVVFGAPDHAAAMEMLKPFTGDHFIDARDLHFGMDRITCPKCGMTSFARGDIENKYCGNCHQFHADMEL